jgi:UDPglucose--hexose-1-phosphate uridylyltransferase
MEERMAELRWNPLLKDWVMIASHRQDRPQMPKEWCPFCPGSGKVPDGYDVLKYDNDFPALMTDPPEPDDVAKGAFKTAPAYGKCEVILYSMLHTATLPQLSLEHIRKLVDLWCERFDELSADDKIKFVFIFENRGEAVGVTMPHPHGQIYAYPYVPKKLQLEIESSREYHQKTKGCLICDMIRDEVEAKERVVFENEDFIVILPFFSEYPYGVYIYSKRHIANITGLDESGRTNLADILKKTTGTLDSLFDYAFPYMMCMHQNSVNTEDGSKEHYHFHIEFYPPMRSRDKIKYNASSETGAWAPCNTRAPEETAGELKKAYDRYLERNGG